MEVAKKPFGTRAKQLTTIINVGLAFSTDFENKTADEIPGRRRSTKQRAPAETACGWPTHRRVPKRAKRHQGKPRFSKNHRCLVSETKI